MQSTTEDFIPILFKVLFGFVGLNIIINFALLYVKRLRIYKLLAIFWPTVLFVFLLQGFFQQGNLEISLAFSSTLLTCSIFSMIGLEVIGRRFPWKPYLIYFASLLPVTYLLYHLGFGFTAVAMPFAIGAATPLIHAGACILVIDRHKSTKLQKILGLVYIFEAIHCINFAVYRMDPGAQLWGWIVAYAMYDIMAILLPSIALEEANLSEQVRLQKLVEDRTQELNKSLKINDSLFKVLIHDISNPLMVMKGYLYMLVSKRPNTETIMEGMQKSQVAMESIISQVKSMHQLKKSNKIPLAPVSIDECFEEVKFIFSHTLKNKEIILKFNNQLPPETRVLADQISLTHSVLSNLVSNGIKFTAPNSCIEVTAKEEASNIILEVKDQGPGIPNEIVREVMENKELQSTAGTLGEKGSGLGLSIVKSFVDSYGGQIEFDSSFMHEPSKSHGTSIRITLDRA